MAKAKTETILNGTAGMEATVAHLQRAIDALDEAVWYFECLGMGTQSEPLDDAQMKAQNVQNLLGVFLERVNQAGPFDGVTQKRAKPLKRPRGRARMALKRAKVAA